MTPAVTRQFWISFSIIAFSVFGALIALYFLSVKIGTATAKVAEDEVLVNQQTGALSVLAQLKQEEPAAAPYQAAMNQLLPAQDGLIDFTQWISGISAQNQVLATVSFDDNTVPASVGVPGEVGFSLQVSGNIDNITTFLDDIESKMPGFLLQINSFDLINQSGDYKFTGEGDLFFR